MHHLVDVPEIAKMLGVSRQRVHQLVARPDFPEPVARLSILIWERAAVEEWMRVTGRPAEPSPAPPVPPDDQP